MKTQPQQPAKDADSGIQGLNLTDAFTQALPGKPLPADCNHQQEHIIWSEVQPAVPSAPTLIAWSADMEKRLGLNIQGTPDASARFFTGSEVAAGSTPYAMRYGGHQFGNWAGQLGDGRAIALGEIQDREGQHWTLQLKGAGQTPYSRQGDGFAVLRSSVREYLCSEAMHNLGIPTTRSLTLCLTGDSVDRDVFYDGNVQAEQGAILCRAAHSFVRFGNFEIHAAHHEHDELKALADHVITRDYPHLGKPGPDVYQQWFQEILQRTAQLMAHWQRVGFVHAVMNTDNMSILGHTIDYGPYGWLEEYDPRWTPNFVDRQNRRYSFGNQPQIGLWNLYRLANAILPLFDNNTKPLEEVLETYNDYYDNIWNNTVAAKLGITDPQPADKALYNSLWETLELTATDYTLFFRKLAQIEAAGGQEKPTDMLAVISDAFYDSKPLDDTTIEAFNTWLGQWAARVADIDPSKRTKLMNSTNPKYVLRNYMALQAIDAAEQGDYSVIEELMAVLQNPYSEQPEFEKYASRRPEWATQRPGCTMLTCSS
ncbi:hypothetical protein AB833_18585 [Chromatiales bacterium (ex Bugula neritina AB1)]|nr:hypothetical protein AB833_18585 [Chromatiales bacterium (ex Bugula neritina AB1)]